MQYIKNMEGPAVVVLIGAILIICGLVWASTQNGKLNAMNVTTLCISMLSLAISSLVAWHLHFKPAKIVGSMSYLKVWEFVVDSNGNVGNQKATPAFWIANVGARPILIEDIRLLFEKENGGSILAYPVNYVPLEAIEETENFNEYRRLSLGGPFKGFALSPQEKWISSYNYQISKENFNDLKGEVKIKIQIKAGGNEKWKTVLEDLLLFGLGSFDTHKQKPKFNIGAVFCRPIYTKRWKLRERELSGNKK